MVGEVRELLDPEGLVFVAGRCGVRGQPRGEAEVGVESRVRVESVNGLMLIVRPLLADAETGEQGSNQMVS
jgi:membrane-bound ClpP family serine protease